MSKSSKRRLARAAIFNNPQRAIGILADVPLLSSSPSEISNLKSPSTPVSSPSAPSTQNSVLLTPVKSLLQAAAQTAASPQRATDTPVGVPLPCSSALNSELSTFNSPSVPSSSELSNLKSPSPPRAIGLQTDVPSLSEISNPSNLKSPSPQRAIGLQTDVPLLPSPSSEISNLKSDLASSSPPSAPSTQNSALLSPTSPLPSAPPPLNSQLPTLSLPSDSAPSAPLPLDPSAPFLQTELPHIQSRLRTAMREWCPSDPRFKPLLETYNTILQNITFERLTSTLPMLDNKNWVETNKQIVRLHAVMERTHSRHSREQRERDTQARREAREKQRIERQAQKQAEALARNQRTQQRDEQSKEQRRQREQAIADRAQEKHELAMRKLDIKERDISTRQGRQSLEQKRESHNSVKPPQSPAAPNPLPPPTDCGTMVP